MAAHAGPAGLLLTLTLVLAGCASAPAGSPAEANVAAEGAAEVRGKVLDDQLRPVVGATVAAQPPNLTVFRQTTTDEGGAFSLGRLPAGEWIVSAVAPAFNSASRAVTVAADEDQDIVLALTSIPVGEAYYETQIGSIYIQYGIAWSIGGDFNRGCLVEGATCQAYASPSANRNFWAEDPKLAPLATIVLEEEWTSTSPVCAKAMAIDVYNPDAPSTTAPRKENPHYWTNYPSERWHTTSPIVMVLPRAEADNPEAIDDAARIERNGGDPLMVRGNWTVRHFPPGTGLTNQPADINCFTDQRFEIYWTPFYLDAAPAGFTARPE